MMLFSLFIICCILLNLQCLNSHSKSNILDQIQTHKTQTKIQQQIKLQISSNELKESGEWFEVTWSGVQNPSKDDWSGIMIADSNPKLLTPIKFKFASVDPNYFQTGSGTTKFQLLNHRYDLQVGFFQGGTSDPVLVATSERIINLNPNQPLQGHISMTGQIDEMLVQWVTKNSSNPTVKWGSKSGVYTDTISAKSVTYSRDQMCGAPATTVGFFDPGLMHYGVISGLKPNQKYFYIFGDPEHGFSQEYSFYSPPLPGPNQDVHILMVADVGQAEEDGSNEELQYRPSLNTTYWISNQNEEYKLLIHNGDISYAQGYVSQWDNFYQQMAPAITKMPYMTSIGNHERDWPYTGDRFNEPHDSGGECGIPHELRTLMPTKTLDTPWYSFDFGPVHFLQYSTEHKFEKGSLQYQFMIDDLRGVNRSVTPWLVVGGHRPMYVDSYIYDPPAGDLDVADDLQAAFEDVFKQYKVDITFHGHFHSYQRTCPVYKHICQGYDEDGVANAPIYIVNGNGGAELDYNINKIKPVYFEVVSLFFGFTKLHVNETTFELLSLKDEDGSLYDELVLKKPVGWGDKYMQENLGQFRPQLRIVPWWKGDHLALHKFQQFLRFTSLEEVVWE